MVKVTFTNGSDSLTLDYVRNISWSTTVNPNVLISTADKSAKLTRSITINGYINKSMWSDNIQAQQQLETDLQSVAVGSIQYQGLTDIEDARFTTLTFDEFRGNPITEFTIEFVTEADNIHAHTPISIGSTALSLTNGFTDLEVDDSLSVQGDDESISKLKSRSFTISGSIVGANLSEVNANAKRLENELDGDATVTLSLSSGSGGDVYTVRPRSIDISSPRLRNQSDARTFSVTLATHDDYLKEPYTLGEVQQTFGAITWDNVESVEHDYDFRTNASGSEKITSENLTVSGKHYFTSWSDYDTARQTWHGVSSLAPNISSPAAYQIVSQTGATLTLRSLSYGELERDGNFPATDAKRYSAQVTGNWEFVASDAQLSIDSSATYLGQSFDTIDSISPTVQLDEVGNVTSRSASVSGTISVSAGLKSSTINSLLALRGTSQQLNSSLANDDAYFINSVNIASVETEFIGLAETVRINVTISGSKLDTAAQAKFFISRTFNLGNLQGGNAPTSPFLNSVTSLSKSFSYTSFAGEERIESISITAGGETWEADNGNGEPTNPTKNIELFNRLDSTLKAPFPTADSGSTGSSQLPDAGNIIPTAQAGESWTITSINLSGWEPFVKHFGAGAGERYWRQTINIGVKVNYDVTGVSGGSGSSPVFVQTESESITEPSPKFVQLQVAGFGTVFKRIGTNPGKATTTIEKKYRDTKVFDPTSTVPDPPTPTATGVGTFTPVKKTTERRNLAIRKTFEFIQTD